MKIISKKEMESLLEKYPNGGIVFVDFTFGNISEILITSKDNRVKELIPRYGEVYSFDWDINAYQKYDKFGVFDNNEILQMIQTLTSELKIPLIDYDEE